MSPLEQLKSVLCDPEGKCCILGSDEDRAIIDRALQALAPPAAAQPAQEPLAWVNQSAIDWLNGNMQGSNEYVQTNLAKRKNNSATVPIFTHPPQRTEQGNKHEKNH